MALDRAMAATSGPWGIGRKDSRTVHAPETWSFGGHACSLRAIVEHRGEVANSGHYVTWVK
eukprot:2220621-Lingulodinium_polyedra.AAC.1